MRARSLDSLHCLHGVHRPSAAVLVDGEKVALGMLAGAHPSDPVSPSSTKAAQAIVQTVHLSMLWLNSSNYIISKLLAAFLMEIEQAQWTQTTSFV